MRLVLTLAAASCCVALSRAEEPSGAIKAEDVAAKARAAVVVISTAGRSGPARSAGSGFVVSAEGIVATNLHVVGEGRSFELTTADNRRLTPRSILAFDRGRDLALVRVAEQGLATLELGDAASLRPGQAAIAVGNPLGLGLSVATGTIAETREIEGRRLLQVAIPVEPGSSGSPLLDAAGKVIGVIAIKSGASTAFAIPVDDVKALLSSPRPIPMERWLTIGALDPQAWQTLLGGEWKQRAGRLVASGAGDGFGGRMLCLSRQEAPAGDFDVAVEVKLEDESGAAGLAFCADGADRHYGFYPTNGSLRLTRFDGPDVFHWTILKTAGSPSYRPGEWNAIHARVRGNTISCRVNGALVIEVDDGGLRGGSAGLVKFRSPGAELRRFRVAPELPAAVTAPETAAEAEALGARVLDSSLTGDEAVEAAARLGEAGLAALAERARHLEEQASKLRDLAESARRRSVLDQLEAALPERDADADLIRAALLVARLDNADLDVDVYQDAVERLARQAGEAIAGRDGAAARFEALLEHFAGDLAFRGSSLEYYHRSNSYLNEVLDDREGIPITLSVLFGELARRNGLNVVGIGLPRHYVVEHRPDPGERQLADPFGGKLLSRDEAGRLAGVPLDASDFEAVTPRQTILRMLNNLLGLAQRDGDLGAMARLLDAVVRLERQPAQLASARWARAALRLRLGDLRGARDDGHWLLEHGGGVVPQEAVEQLLKSAAGRDE